MQINTFEHNERLMILADHRAQISSSVIRGIATTLSRRGLIISSSPDPTGLDWEALYTSAGQCLSSISGFEDADETRVANTVHAILANTMPNFVESVLREHSRAATPRSARNTSPAASMYTEFVRGHRDALAKDASAILSVELEGQGLKVSRTRFHMRELTSVFCRDLYEQLADNDKSRPLWEGLDEYEKASTAASIEPIMRPFTAFLLRHIIQTGLDIKFAPVS